MRFSGYFSRSSQYSVKSPKSFVYLQIEPLKGSVSLNFNLKTIIK